MVITKFLFFYSVFLFSLCMNPVKIYSQEIPEETGQYFTINRNSLTKLSPTDITRFDQISELGAKKIVAIGETAHGAETMSEIAYQLIRRQIEHNGCRLVLTELSLEMMLSFNRFVQGDESFSLDSLLTSFNMDFISLNSLKEFCLWLREYNRDAAEKVWFLGADYSHSSIECIYLCDYLYNVNKIKDSPAVIQLYRNIYGALFTGNYTDALTTFSDSYHLLEEAVGQTEAAIIKHCISTLDSMIKSSRKDGFKMETARDSVMFVNTDFLMNLIKPEKTVIFQHWSHVNYMEGGFPVSRLRPFGSYLKEKYDSSMYCLSIRSQCGSYLSAVMDTVKMKFFMTVQQMEEPPTGSLEYYLSQVRDNFFHVPSSVFPMLSLQARIIGNRKYPIEFTDVSIAGEDGILFIRRSEAFYYPPEKFNEPLETKTTGMLVKHLNIYK